MRAILLGLMIWWAALSAAAQDLSGLARVNLAESRIADGWLGGATVTLALSQGAVSRLYAR